GVLNSGPDDGLPKTASVQVTDRTTTTTRRALDGAVNSGFAEPEPAESESGQADPKKCQRGRLRDRNLALRCLLDVQDIDRPGILAVAVRRGNGAGVTELSVRTGADKGGKLRLTNVREPIRQIGAHSKIVELRERGPVVACRECGKVQARIMRCMSDRVVVRYTSPACAWEVWKVGVIVLPDHGAGGVEHRNDGIESSWWHHVAVGLGSAAVAIADQSHARRAICREGKELHIIIGAESSHERKVGSAGGQRDAHCGRKCHQRTHCPPC